MVMITDPIVVTEQESVAPHKREAEEATIGSVLIDPDCFPLVNVIVGTGDFYIHRHRWIWDAFLKLRQAGKQIDFRTVCDQLTDMHKLEDVGGASYLTALLVNTPSSMHAESYAKTVREMSLRRDMLSEANELARQAFDYSTPLKNISFTTVKNAWTLAELHDAQFPEIRGPLPGIIPNGLTIFGGRPKRGKSWFMLQAGCTFAIGGKFFESDLEIGRVLYYALEDPPRRLKERTARLNIDPSALIEFRIGIKPLQLGGLAEIESAARSEGFQMIVIDTIRRAMPGKDFTKDGALYDDILSRLQTIAHETNIAIVVILHTRKSTAGLDPDPVDDVLGSTGLTASADCVLALYRDAQTSNGRLLGRQRDGEDIDLTIYFDPVTCAWQSKGDTEKIHATESEQEILDVLKDLKKAKAPTIAEIIGKNKKNTATRLTTLYLKGRVSKEMIDGIPYYFLREDVNGEQVKPLNPLNPLNP
jgi:replicative DNA helicase